MNHTRHTRRLKFALLLTLLIALAACSRSTPQPPTNQPVDKVTLLNEDINILFQIGDDQEIKTSAAPNGLTSQALEFSLESTSKGLIDKAGTRYLYGTFEVKNNSSETYNNLSFYALSTTRTLGGTALSDLRNARNEAITDPLFARTILPTHRTEDNYGRLAVKADEADFQGLSDAQISDAQSQVSSGRTVLGYGFSARNAQGQRAITPGQTGFVTFAIKFPFDPNSSAEYPFAFTLSFAAVDDNVRQVTRSAEENANSAADVCARGDAIGAQRVVVIGQRPNNAPCTVTRLVNVKTAVAANGEDAVYLLPDAPTEPDVDVKVNFQDKNTTPPAGYLRDFGEPFGVRSASNQGNGEYSYGWIDVNSGAPVALDGSTGDREQGRNRSSTGQSDLRLATLIHMDHPSTPPKGYWEIALPSGTYSVTVAVGEPDPGTDPEIHRINAEGVTIINNYAPSGARGSDTRHTTASGIVNVTDGRLTLDYAGGVNTKINYVEITSTDASACNPAPLCNGR